MIFFQRSRTLGKAWRRLAVAVLVVFVGTVIYTQVMILSYRQRIVTKIDTLPSAPVAVVFGAGLKPDHTLTNALRDRVLAGIALYKAHKVQKILMTGDDGEDHADEVTPMKAFAVAYGVPAEDIVIDYAGFRTLDSCYRARAIFGLEKIIAVSQAFHLSRIAYLCGHAGIDTVVYAADREKYADIWRWQIREFLARYKAWLDVAIVHKQPRFLGKPAHIFYSPSGDKGQFPVACCEIRKSTHTPPACCGDTD